MDLISVTPLGKTVRRGGPQVCATITPRPLPLSTDGEADPSTGAYLRE